MRKSILLATLAAALASAAEPDFAKSGYPFLEKHCLECHGDKVQKSDVSFAKFKDPAELLKDRNLWKVALHMAATGEMPPPKKPRPSDAEIKAFIASVSTVFEQADRNAKPDAGRVLMHRLTRAEYNNTVRDLLDLDLNASEDFPADEVGHGFDNISEVQWISAVHMERYLAAAEMCAQRAVAPVPAKPPVRSQAGRYMEPASSKVPQSKFRPVSNEDADIIHTGPLHAPVQIPPDGEFRVRAKVYAEPADKDHPVRIALLACGKNVTNAATDDEAAQIFGGAAKTLRPFRILKIVEVKARTEKTAEVIETKMDNGIGVQRMAVALIKPSDGSPVPKLFFEFAAIEGPLDTRPAFQRKNLPSAPEGSKEKYLRDFLARFLTRAFRRPATPAEIERYLKVSTLPADSKQPWESGVQYAIQAILSSPKFLFRPEASSLPAIPGAQPLDDFELASRLSYFLWSSMPDDELFALAEKKQLAANIDAQVRRMLRDPKARALTENFAMQWLQLRRLALVMPDAKVFPQGIRLKPAMLEETTRFIDAIFREDHSLLDLIDAKFTFLNEPLAKLYGIADTNGNRAGKKPIKPAGTPIQGNDFKRVELADDERGGLLTQASILTVASNPTRTSPVKRGKWVLDQLLGMPIPPPPANVPDLDTNKVLTGTLRQRLEQHRANPSCAACHDRMDPLGFAFENYDAIGAFRTKDGNDPIDAAATLPDGQSIKGSSGLKDILKKKKDLFARSLTEKMLTYALGRGLEVYDTKSVDRIMQSLTQNDYKVSTLIAEVAKSDPFRLKRAAE